MRAPNDAASNGTGPGNGFVDRALPVQYATRNATAEVGYNTGTLDLSASWLVSKFTDGNDVVRWSNPFWANGLDATDLAPDKKYKRLALNGTLRALPVLDISLEAILKQNKYRGVTFDRTKDTRSELHASASWGDFEKWRYNDISHDGQTCTIPYPGVTNNTSQSYLNGYLAHPNFEANIVYLLATFKF